MKDKNLIIKRIMTSMLCLFMLMSGFGTRVIHAEPAESEKFVIQRDPGAATQSDVLVDGKPRVVYCMQYDYLWPIPDIPGYANAPTKYWEASEDEMLLNSVQLKTIQKILYAGYPYNAAGALDPMYDVLGGIAAEYARELTQHVIWSTMAEWGISANTHYAAGSVESDIPGWNESEKNLRKFISDGTIIPAPSSGAFTPELQGNTIFLKQHDGYHTGKLKITNPDDFTLSYEVYLPNGVVPVDKDGNEIEKYSPDFFEVKDYYLIKGGEEFSLKTNDPSKASGKTVTINGSISEPEDVKQYMTSDTGKGDKGDGQGYVQHPFQTMLSVGLKTTTYSNIVKLLSEDDLGSITISKEVASGSRFEAEGAEFWFELDIDITDIDGNEVGAWFPYKRVIPGSGEKNGEIYHYVDKSMIFELKDGESITISDLPLNADYTLTEYGLSEVKTDAGLGNWKPVYEPSSSKIEKNTTVKVTNTYKPSYTETSLDFTATKSMIDKDDGDKLMAIAENQFHFALISDASGQPMPKDCRGDESVKSNGACGEGESALINFNKITFIEPGNYIYTIEELPVDHGNITRDHSRYTVEVKVESDAEGKLSAVPSYKKDGADVTEIVFVNEYERDTINEEIVIFKKVENTNSDRHLSKGGFEFRIKPVGSATSALVNGASETTVTSDDFGEAICEFTLLADATMFEENDTLTFEYEISEVAGSDSNWKYDDSSFTAVISVTRIVDPGTYDVTYTSSVTYKNAAGEVLSSKPEFKNTYTAKEAETKVSITKEFSSPYTPSNGETFVFGVNDDFENDKTGYSAPEKISVVFDGTKVSETGSADFKFSKAGEYRFEIYEIDTDAVPGMIYDSESWIVDIHVSDKDGELKTEKVYYRESEGHTPKTEIVFTNAYESTAAAKLDLTKVLSGREWKNSDEFLVVISHSEEIGATEGSAAFDPCDPHNTESGHTYITHPAYAVFTKDFQSRTLDIEFHEAGVYYLHLKERASSIEDGIEYDATDYIVEYIVGRKEGGNDLEVKKTSIYDVTGGWSRDKEVYGVKFTNRATNFTITKVDNEGSKTAEFEFTLTVKDKNGSAFTGMAGTLDFDENGQVKFTLKRGESIQIIGLPADAEYEVAESDAIRSKTTVTTVTDGTNTDKVTGKTVSGILKAGKVVEVRYTNVEPEPDSGKPSYTVPDTSVKAQ